MSQEERIIPADNPNLNSSIPFLSTVRWSGGCLNPWEMNYSFPMDTCLITQTNIGEIEGYFSVHGAIEEKFRGISYLMAIYLVHMHSSSVSTNLLPI